MNNVEDNIINKEIARISNKIKELDIVDGDYCIVICYKHDTWSTKVYKVFKNLNEYINALKSGKFIYDPWEYLSTVGVYF